MTSRRFSSHLRFAVWSLIAVLGCTAAVQANTTNSVPGESFDSFESYTNGTVLTGTNGWYGTAPTGAVVMTESYDFPLRQPLDDDTHTNILAISDTVSNLLDNSPFTDTNIWVDVMVNPLRSAVEPEVDDEIQLAMYFNTNGHMVIRHRYWVNGSDQAVRWTELDHDPVGTDEWARVTVKLDYRTTTYGQGFQDRFFQVSLNGGGAISNFYGSPKLWTGVEPDYGPPPWTNGSWFVLVNAPTLTGPDGVNAIEVQGTGKIDDLVVTNGEVFASTRWKVATTAGTGGDIYPGGDVMIPDGDDVTFTITPDPGYAIDDVLVDSVSTGAVSSVSFLNVTSEHELVASFVATSGLGTPHDWLDTYATNPIVDYDAADLEDWDGDGALNWEERVAGTLPDDTNSVFEILDVMFLDGSNKVVWFGTTNFGVTTPFSMYRSTNDLTADEWDLIESNTLPRAADGTNIYWDTTAPDGLPAYYQPTIIWVVE
ncbi:MAG: hypothetical protein QGH15_08215 [Kiritimatiellia bacterium]|nr:hypothetical protein [Kiritimatiellia bacterium]